MDNPQFGDLLRSWWTFELFLVFHFVNKTAIAMWVQIFIGTHVFFFGGKYIRMGVLDGMLSLDSTLEETAKLFSQVVVTLCIPTRGVWEFHVLHIFVNLVLSLFLNFRHSGGCLWYLTLVLISVSLQLTMWKIFWAFICLLWWNVSFKYFTNFFHVICLLIELKE